MTLAPLLSELQTGAGTLMLVLYDQVASAIKGQDKSTRSLLRI